MLFTFNFVSEVFSTFKGRLNNDAVIHHVLTDSREPKENSLFIPIIGERFDGHDFLQAAIDNGAVASVWQKNHPVPEDVPNTFVFFLVDDTLEALQKLAAAYRNYINPLVIGVTGSNGKTTTKDLLKSVLHHSYQTHATIGNYNNEIGLPLTILQMNSQTEVLILEMGMNHFNEIDTLTKLARPDYAIITNIGESHIEHLGSRSGIAKAKLEIINGLDENGILIMDGDEPLLFNIQNDFELITCGFNENNQVHIDQISVSEKETVFVINDDTLFHIPLLGKHHAHNASFVIALARRLGIGDELIQTGLNEVAHSTMRFERIKGKHGVTLINDAYNASLTSMKAAIEVVKQLDNYQAKVLVLGDILELGEHAKEFHQNIAGSIDQNIDAVFTIGEDAAEITAVLTDSNLSGFYKHFTNKESLTKAIEAYLNKNTVILFKASRMMRLEEIVEACK